MTRNEYNGWFNYETWNYNQYMMNDYDSYKLIVRIATKLHKGQTVSCYDPIRKSSEDFSILGDDKSKYYTSKHALADYLLARAWVEMERELKTDDAWRVDKMTITDSTWVRSALIGAIQECNFFEIASHIIEDDVMFDEEMKAYAEDIDQQAHAQGRESSVD